MYGKKPSPRSAARRCVSSALPATQSGGPPGRTGGGSIQTSASRRSRLDRRNAHPRSTAERSRASRSSAVRAARRARRTTSNSLRLSPPTPSARTSRPFEMRSTPANSFAKSVGCRRGAIVAAGPIAIRSVAQAIAVDMVTASQTGRWKSTCSPVKNRRSRAPRPTGRRRVPRTPRRRRRRRTSGDRTAAKSPVRPSFRQRQCAKQRDSACRYPGSPMRSLVDLSRRAAVLPRSLTASVALAACGGSTTARRPPRRQPRR